MIRIVIVDDHGLIRECLHLVFGAEKRFDIVGEAANGFQAIDVIEAQKPDVALLDIKIPGMSGIDLLPVIKRKSPGTRVLMLTGKDDEETVVRALKAGARGYLSKDTTSTSLIKAVKVVHDGDMWIERRLVSMLFDEPERSGSNLGIDRKENPRRLTPREQDVLKCLSKGLTNKEISKHLYISEKTVKSHVNSIFKKLNVSRRLEAVLYAIKAGLS